jgi:hypothetical protein
MKRAKLTKANLQNKVSISEKGCWLWSGARKTAGTRGFSYGWVTLDGKQQNAHRAVWALFFGDIPRGFYVCHKCDVPLCVNPDHLFLGTPSDNMQDMWNKNRHKRPDESNLHRKLSNEQVSQIVDLLSTGETQKLIANKYGVSQACISNINTKRSWGRA